MATQRDRNFQKGGRGTYVGKDPFDGALKKAFTSLGVDTDAQRNYISRINSIAQLYPNVLVGKNPYYIARAFIQNTLLPNTEIDADQLINSSDPDDSSNVAFTIIRYILWLRSLENTDISSSIFPTDWKEEIMMTRESHHYVRPSIFLEDEDEDDF